MHSTKNNCLIWGRVRNQKDTNNLAEKILLGLDREWDREAILMYAEQFTWKNVVKKILEVYRGVDGS